MDGSMRLQRSIKQLLPVASHKERGIALILCLLVLLIVLVIAVQFNYSVELEERIANNSSSDENLGLAARGAFYHLAAQFKADEAGEIQVGDYELKDADTLAEPWMDEKTTDSRKFSSDGDAGDSSGGGIQISYTVVDLGSRFNINWLMCENKVFKKHAEDSLKRLLKRLGHPDEFYDALKSFITGEGEEETESTASTEPATTATDTEGVVIAPRQLLSLDELWDIEFENIGQILTGKDENGEEVEDTKPLLDYLTVWNTAGLNYNTAVPELLASWWPAKDLKKTKPTNFTTAIRTKATKEIIRARLHLEGDEDFDVEEEEEADPDADAADPNSTENTDPNAPVDEEALGEGEEQAASEWIGKGPLKNYGDIAKQTTLKFIFSQQSGKGPPKTKPSAAAAGSGGEVSPGAASLKNWYDAVTFKSRLYKVRITATQGGSPAKIFEAIIFRGETEAENRPAVESQVLEWRQVGE
jgi:hypothetical protein